jgi:hypothetical protein
MRQLTERQKMTTIKVDTAAAGVEISPRLFGVFLEDLNQDRVSPLITVLTRALDAVKV